MCIIFINILGTVSFDIFIGTVKQNLLVLSPFGMHIITPSLCVVDNSHFLKPSFSDLTTKDPSCNQKN